MGSAPGAYRYRSVHGGAAAWPGALAKLGYRLTYTRYRDSRIRSPSSSPSSLSSSGCCCTLLSPSLSLSLSPFLFPSLLSPLVLAPLSSTFPRIRALRCHPPKARPLVRASLRIARPLLAMRYIFLRSSLSSRYGKKKHYNYKVI